MYTVHVARVGLFNMDADFQAIYERLGVTLTERGESFYQPLMGDIVEDMESKSQFELDVESSKLLSSIAVSLQTW